MAKKNLGNITIIVSIENDGVINFGRFSTEFGNFSGEFPTGSNISIAALPNEGFKFISWEGKFNNQQEFSFFSAEPQTTLVRITNNCEIRAFFEAET